MGILPKAEFYEVQIYHLIFIHQIVDAFIIILQIAYSILFYLQT